MKYFDKGIDEQKVKAISAKKNEPKWMLDYRITAYKEFIKSDLPEWGPDISDISFDNIIYHASDDQEITNDWREIPPDIKKQFDDLGIPEHERAVLAGVSTQYESEIIYHRLRERYVNYGIVFDSIENGLRDHEGLFKRYFGKLVNYDENKFTALNSSVWSGGSFVYIPKGVKMDLPIETYFRINADRMGQFERTLIIADEGSEVHYIEGCTAPQYLNSSLHSAVVEIFALKGSKVRYTTLQNWSKNVYNLVTKRAIAEADASVEWLDINIGSKVTMKYPTVVLNGKRASGSVNSIAMSSSEQTIDSGAKMIHKAPDTHSIIKSTTISKDDGVSVFRGLIDISKSARNSRSYVKCDNVLLSDRSIARSYPVIKVKNDSSVAEHEAIASNISKEQLSYLSSRGLNEDLSRELILSGYFSEFNEQLPLEYSIELERIIQLFNKGVDEEGHKRK